MNGRAWLLLAWIMAAAFGAGTACAAPLASDDHVFFPLVPGNPRDDGAIPLTLEPDQLRAATGWRDAVIPSFTLDADTVVDLALDRFDPFDAGARLVVVERDGEHPIAMPDVQCWRGHVVGDPSSAAFLVIGPAGTSGYVREGPRQWIISSGRFGRSQTLVFAADSAAGRSIDLAQPVCAGEVALPGATIPPEAGDYPSRDSSTRVFRLAIDTDAEFLSVLFGGDVQGAVGYIATVVAGMNDIYLRDVNVGFDVTYVRIWGVPAPWTATSTSTQLPEFRDYWNSTMTDVSRHIATLWCGRALGGGIAYTSVACNPSYGYSVCSNLNGYFPYPTRDHSAQNWDIDVTCHEIGHNLGTGHTHDPAWYNPPIDGCGNAYLNPPQAQDCSLAYQGTIMSYCHLCPGGVSNIVLAFGSRVSSRISSYVRNSPCYISPSITIVSSPSDQGVCDGDIITLDVSALSDVSLSYQWKRHEVKIPGATKPVLTFDPVSEANQSDYECLIYNRWVSRETPSMSLDVHACPCDPDYNLDGEPDVSDILDLAADIAGNTRSHLPHSPDFNRDGSPDLADILDLASSIAGGPCP